MQLWEKVRNTPNRFKLLYETRRVLTSADNGNVEVSTSGFKAAPWKRAVSRMLVSLDKLGFDEFVIISADNGNVAVKFFFLFFFCCCFLGFFCGATSRFCVCK